MFNDFHIINDRWLNDQIALMGDLELILREIDLEQNLSSLFSTIRVTEKERQGTLIKIHFFVQSLNELKKRAIEYFDTTENSSLIDGIRLSVQNLNAQTQSILERKKAQSIDIITGTDIDDFNNQDEL